MDTKIIRDWQISKSMLNCFQTRQGPSRGLLRDCENFGEGSLPALLNAEYTAVIVSLFRAWDQNRL